MGANDNKIILWWGLQAPRFLTSGRDIWVQIVRGKVGLSGRGGRALGCLITGDSAKIHLLGFSIQRLWGKSLEISRNFSMGPLFSKFDSPVPMTWGYDPYFILGLNTYFLRRDIDFQYCKLLKTHYFLQKGLGRTPYEQ